MNSFREAIWSRSDGIGSGDCGGASAGPSVLEEGCCKHYSSELATVLIRRVLGHWRPLRAPGVRVTGEEPGRRSGGLWALLYQGFNVPTGNKIPRGRGTSSLHSMLRTHIKFGWPAILYGKDTEIFQQASEGLDAKELGENYLDNWRRRGPIAKLHNFVLWVRSSPQRSQMFKGIFVEDLESDSDQDTAAVSTAALQLILNNATRWNSTYLTIKWLQICFSSTSKASLRHSDGLPQRPGGQD
ncbi:hypothetical protein E4U26_007212 [Claviceps purpurea]|nr:hypothetical protein E4U26_007212 [Claviceps purpurea]